MVSRKTQYTGLDVRSCILRTGVQDRTYESQSGRKYRILGLPIDTAHSTGATVLVRYLESGRETYLDLEKILGDREVAVFELKDNSKRAAKHKQ
ncbi:MAG: hypothetical protein AABY16_02210 [Nanoarchaeota archaeon]